MQGFFQLGNINRLKFGLSWDILGEETVDLDASCVFFDGYARIIDAVFYNQLDIGYAVHSGDNKTGEGEGFDETIEVDISKLDPNVESFMLIVNCYSGGNFLNVETAEAKILNAENEMVLTESLVGCKGPNTGLVLCMCFKDEKLGWMFREIGRVCNGRNFKECEPVMREELRFLVPEELENEMRWDKTSTKTFDLKKGDELHLSDLKKVTMGLGWDTRCDLDAAVIEFGLDGELVERVYFGHKTNKNSSIIHHGDNRTGEGEGDDEQITVHLDRVSHLTGFLVFMVNVYTNNSNFSQVEGAFSRLFMTKPFGKEMEICRYNLTEQKNSNGVVMAIICRDNDMKTWMFKAVGGDVESRVAQANEAKVYVTPQDLKDLEDRLKGKTDQKIQEMEIEVERLSQPVLLQNAVMMKCRAEKVDKMDLFGKSDPYYVIKGPDGSRIFKSEIIKVTLNPVWKQVTVKNITPDVNVNGVYTMEVWDWNKLTADDYIGSFAFVPSQVKPGISKFELVNEKKKKKKKKKYKNSGVFIFDRFSTQVYDQSDVFYRKKRDLEAEKRRRKEMFDSFKRRRKN